jgi:purine-binding chemotaxis protein CheW
MSATTCSPRGAVGSAQSDLQFVSFLLGEHSFGIHVNDVCGVYRGLPVIPTPQTSRYLTGEVQLSNRRVPVVNLRRMAQMSDLPTDEDRQWMVMVRSENGPVGFIVDRVTEVVRLTETDLEIEPTDAPQFGANFISAVAEHRGQKLFLPDLTRLTHDAIQ